MVFAIKLLMYLRQGLIVDFLTFFFCLPISILALVWWLICWGIWLLETRSNVYWKNVLTEECGVSGDDLLIYESKRFSLLYFFKYWSDSFSYSFGTYCLYFSFPFCFDTSLFPCIYLNTRKAWGLRKERQKETLLIFLLLFNLNILVLL